MWVAENSIEWRREKDDLKKKKKKDCVLVAIWSFPWFILVLR